jgi:hypothetical protein
VLARESTSSGALLGSAGSFSVSARLYGSSVQHIHGDHLQRIAVSVRACEKRHLCGSDGITSALSWQDSLGSEDGRTLEGPQSLQRGVKLASLHVLEATGALFFARHRCLSFWRFFWFGDGFSLRIKVQRFLEAFGVAHLSCFLCSHPHSARTNGEFRVPTTRIRNRSSAEVRRGARLHDLQISHNGSRASCVLARYLIIINFLLPVLFFLCMIPRHD